MRTDTSEVIRELLQLQASDGWLAPDRLEALAEKLRLPLHRLESVSTFYTHFRRVSPKGPVVEVCRDLSCRLAGGAAACERLEALSNSSQAEAAEVSAAFEVQRVSCLGRCDQAPAAAIGDRVFDAGDSEAILAGVAAPGSGAAPEVDDSGEGAWAAADPYAASRSDYRVLRQLLAGNAERAMAELEAAGLRGMGGAGFPTARKWSMVAAEVATPKHVICNADESEPGTFKDRAILHDLPHLVIEGMALAAYCVGAERGTVFIRHEYGPERVHVEAAIDVARRAGALGEKIFGSDFSFDIDVFVSPGGYILGEETALLECMEGRRGEPRNKPPFPGQRGLRGQPTLINNVETLVHAVSIIGRGAEWWHEQGEGEFAGHKFVSVSGDVVRPGVSLFPLGVSLRDVLASHGGMVEGRDVLAIAPGGASSNFLGTEALDLALDFDALAEAGTMLGSGAVVFVAEGRDLLDLGLSITRFFRNESCGKCVPCRVGSEKAVALIEEAVDSEVALDLETLETLRTLNGTMQQTSICGFGQVAQGPLLSILARFPEAASADARSVRR